MPIVPSVGTAPGYGSASAVGEAIVVTTPAELRDALSQREKPITIGSAELQRWFAPLARLAAFGTITSLLYLLLALAIEKGYQIEFQAKWTVERTFDGKITLTPKR